MYDGQGNRKYLNEKERKAFFRAVLHLEDSRRKAFCLTLFFTGCRLSEALNLTTNQIDFSENVILFNTLKRRTNGHFRAVPIPNKLARVLHEIRAEPNDRIWSFSRTSAWRVVKSVMIDAKLSGVMASPKGLRHTFAVSYLSANVPLPLIQRWMGHSSLKNTSIYLNVAGSEDRKFASMVWSENLKNQNI